MTPASLTAAHRAPAAIATSNAAGSRPAGAALLTARRAVERAPEKLTHPFVSHDIQGA